MRVTIRPGGTLGAAASVPGDKSIAHRWLILAATARGRSVVRDLPPGLDVRATASCLAAVAPSGRAALEGWAAGPPASAEASGFTWHGDARSRVDGLPDRELAVEGHGRDALRPAAGALDCGNSGTSIRLLAGLLAAAPHPSVLTGDESLRARPMERVAEPLRAMGADVRTTDGHAPIEIEGGPLEGITYRSPVPSAQVKGAVLLAGLAAHGETVVEEPAPTRDHTERAVAALGGPVDRRPGRVRVERFQHGGFEARVPGDVSSAAFLVAAAGLTGSALTVRRVGLNPSRTAFLGVMERMGVHVRAEAHGEELGEPVGDLVVEAGGELAGTRVSADELPLVIDEVPVLAALAAHAHGETWFVGAGELRVKESDRLAGIADGLRDLGGHAAVEGDDLVVGGVPGVAGGTADARRDHRLAMAFAVAALRAERPCVVEGFEWAEVSFPGFAGTLARLGLDVEVSR